MCEFLYFGGDTVLIMAVVLLPKSKSLQQVRVVVHRIM